MFSEENGNNRKEKKMQLKLAFTINMLILFSFCEIYKGNADQLLN